MTAAVDAGAAIVPDSASADLRRAAAAVGSPALLYDAAAITRTVENLRADLAPVADARLCFAVKANRFPPLLRHLAALGLGADVASEPELEAALASGLHPVHATGPALSATALRASGDAGALPDVDSLARLRELAAAADPPSSIGLRVRVPVSPSDAQGAGLRWSRFGVDATDPELHRLLADSGIRVVRLHAHTGELATPERVVALVRLLLNCLRVFPDVTGVNIGGGLTLLYAVRDQARRAWRETGILLDAYRTAHGRCPELVVEPGMLLTAMAGFLSVAVTSVDRDPGGRRIITVDASGWALLDWARPRVVGVTPDRHGPARPYDIAGASCYENDYLLRAAALPPVEEGDRLLLSSAGAYVSSMARTMHGLPLPAEWLVDGEEVTGREGEFLRVPR